MPKREQWKVLSGSRADPYRVGSDERGILWVEGGGCGDDAEEYAQLIAAAPDLLAALEAMIDNYGIEDDGDRKAQNQARAAIDRAKGKQ